MALHPRHPRRFCSNCFPGNGEMKPCKHFLFLYVCVCVILAFAIDSVFSVVAMLSVLKMEKRNDHPLENEYW